MNDSVLKPFFQIYNKLWCLTLSWDVLLSHFWLQTEGILCGK